MTTEPRKAKDIFVELIGSVPPDQWDERLEQACQGDNELGNRVRALLRAHTEPGSFLEQPAIADDATLNHQQPISEQPGTQIGPYKLLQQIGEGGMGVVFMAEQTEPIERTVALKIIKPGMDTRQVIARFEAERQAVALMDHPNIARVLDVGATDAGLPYFVMDLVKGVPITDYCDQQHLPVRERLELVSAVCHAVQHAHQKGIIHRDLKPSNVLVAEYDGQPVPKVIDFGVAKATAQRLTEKTMFTELGQMVGTVEYMSPEQARFNQLDVDTRSDIYSLGVLLYELLAGSTPFEGKRLHEAAFDEMLRIIREEEPPKPSTRLSTTEGLPSIAANRGLEPLKLNRLVQGELDWIVMKALEKDRNRRYETANGLAADIERHLQNEPVEAGPPSASYRFRKFALRNKVALATAITSTLVALVAVGSIGWAVRDRAARSEQLAQERTARQAKISGQLELILDEVARLEQKKKWSEALVSARRAEPVLAAGEAPPDMQQRVRLTLANLELVRQLDEIRAQSGTVWGSPEPILMRLASQADQDYAAAFRNADINIDALSLDEAANQLSARREVSAAVLPALDDWVAVRSKISDQAATEKLVAVLRTADPDPWRQRLRDALGRKDWPALENLAKSPDLDRQPAATITFLCAALREQAESDIDTPGKIAGELGPRGFFMEIDILRRAQRNYPSDFWINHRLGITLIGLETPDLVVAEGIGYMRAAVALRPESSHAIMNLGNGYAELGNQDEAIACYRRAIELAPGYWICYTNLGHALRRKSAYEEAIACYEQSIKLNPDGGASAQAALAMLLSNCPAAELRNPPRAIELANRATQLEPNAGDYWTALGVARYRDGQWQTACTALDRSLELGTGGTGGGNLREKEAIDLFFLAMSHWQMSQHNQARQCYDRAAESMGQQLTHDEQLLRFQTEAKELLQITDEKPTTTQDKN